MDTSKIEQIIVEEVLKYLKTSENKSDISTPKRIESIKSQQISGDILVMLFGGHAGLTELCLGLKKQVELGRQVVLHQSKSSKLLHNTDDLHKNIPGIKIASKMDLKCISDYNVLILGCLTRTTAAKISLGITDNFETIAVYTALSQGIPVVATSESLHNPDCDYCGGNIPKLQEISNQYKNTITDMGISFILANNLAEELSSFWDNSDSTGITLPTIKGVVTTEDISNWDQKEFWIMPGTILTAMARDLLLEKNVAIKEK